MKALKMFASAILLVGGFVGASESFGVAASGASLKECPPAQLKVSLAQGAAGTTYYTIVFTNTGATCALWGVPSIQPVLGGPSRSRAKVGPPARNDSMGMMPARHVVTTRHSVSDSFGVTDTGNFPTNACRPKNARAIVVSLGNFVRQAYVPLKISVCTERASTSTRLVVAGATGVSVVTAR